MGRDNLVRGFRLDCGISIHAPRMGRDRCIPSPLSTAGTFQSTRPVWGATYSVTDPDGDTVFQSTRPVWGATAAEYNTLVSYIFQSTRPVWGATEQLRILVKTCAYFNPRAPYGARQGSLACFRAFKRFQSTRPVWGATPLPPEC